MEHLTGVLLIHDDAIEDHQRLRVALQGVHTADVHVRTHGEGTAALRGMHVGTQLIDHLRLDVAGRRELQRTRADHVGDVVIVRIEGTHGITLQHDVPELARLVQTHADAVVAGNGHTQRAAVEGYF